MLAFGWLERLPNCFTSHLSYIHNKEQFIVPKGVFNTLQGEGVPAALLSTTASHVEEIRRFVSSLN
ncbi:unnamed protein product [Meloidogyne enterolobii]|uniref:Uncharacterized protein n=1 Tax=Meloidogyne enterolobii TaxID=390850 RepID=A0ACB0ZL97_MELEN